MMQACTYVAANSLEVGPYWDAKVNISHDMALTLNTLKTNRIHKSLYTHAIFSFSLLNQARAVHRPACTWFLKNVSVQTSVYVCVYVCVCVSAPEAINN